MQGKLSIGSHVHIKSFSDDDLRKLGRRPVGATRFFIGDRLGGSGWEVELFDGVTEKYYVDLPTSIAEVKQLFTNFPENKTPGLHGKCIEDLCELYLEKLEVLVKAAEKYFLDESQAMTAVVRSRPHLRLVQ
jgi:hypothetical protein